MDFALAGILGLCSSASLRCSPGLTTPFGRALAGVADPVITNPFTTGERGYVYELLRQIGLSDFAARTGQFVLVGPFRILAIVIGAVLLGRWGATVLRRSVAALRLRAPMRTRSARMEQRARTIAEAVANAWRAVVMVVAALMVLSELGVNLIPLLAGASIAGIAIGLGAQSLIRDYLSGLFILAEDQFGVGDVISVGAVSGSVEDLTLRVTRLRSADGTVWFLPNGDIRALGNQSMEWSRAIVDVTIGYDNDIAAVLAMLVQEAENMRTDEAFQADMLEPPEVQGVQSMGADGVTIRVMAKTAPRRQWAVARELRTRITDRLQRDGVKGAGRMVVVSSGTLEAGTPPPVVDTER